MKLTPERAIFKTRKNQNTMQNFIQYLKDTKGEMKHVSWPTKSQTVAFTSLVVVISVVGAFLLGLFDAGFKKALEFLLSK